MNKHLISFGHGYSAAALAKRLLPQGWHISGTTRSPETAEKLRAEGINSLIFGSPEIEEALASATHLLTVMATQSCASIVQPSQQPLWNGPVISPPPAFTAIIKAVGWTKPHR
jgi:3-hydroxyisobutyrate dehydrogenase-like beta-hydroxyacid dehydrogenase